ncbi:hypothetical protein EIN_168100 [Entamoeba invadens IP1]|uniref:AP180 N-terminal homology (ANTH) domain-containing protein n=1 Tax=Entamoeba invadens IP1 TaxID=370355 RepID=A0A0A1TY46_ENTIV|nr:hypothetical protein EIN_168100 [Entamoeba invadens IP1]ELP84455.1 hypothetical protein EIN_168100 [Entamoeba invadens IP1]|eukprot:XP_004183801.1 hypothetical protein EIN_168100 [Entamoeba invadens IP1]
MNYLKLHYMLHEFFDSLYANEGTQFNYFVARSFKGDTHAIAKKIKKNIKTTHTLVSFKSMLLYHYISRNGNPEIYNRIENLTFVKKRNAENVFEPDTSHLSHWGELYSVPLQHALNFHKKYSCFNGQYTLYKGESIPEFLRTPVEIGLLETETFMLFKSFNSFVGDFFRKQTANDYLQQSISMCIDEMVDIFKLLLLVTNYKSLLEEKKFERQNVCWCSDELKTIQKQLVSPFLKIPPLLEIPALYNIKNNKDQLRLFLVKFPIKNYKSLEKKVGPVHEKSAQKIKETKEDKFVDNFTGDMRCVVILD